MSTRPSIYPFWTDGDPSKVTQPPGDVLLMGWTPGEPPPMQWFNWWMWIVGLWIAYLDQFTEDAVPENSYRLINGGLWSFDATTKLLAWTAAANLAVPSVPDSSNQFAAGSVTLNDGDIAYLTPNFPFNTKGDVDGVTNIISNANFTGDITNGMAVTGPGIPGGTTVIGVTPTSVLLSATTTSAHTQATYVFVSTGALTVLTGANTAVVLQPNQVLLARRAGNTVYLGVNAPQMTLQDKEFKALIGSGYFSFYTATAGENLTAGQVVYISEGGIIDSGRTQGDAYKLDCSATGSPHRAVYAGVVITTVTSGLPATIVYSGFYPEVGLSPGEVYYADPTTPGGITNVIPSGAGQKIVPVGFAVTSTSLLLTGAQGSGSMTFPVFFEDTPYFGNGTQTSFPLSQEPLSANSIFVSINGLIIPNSKWSLSGIQTVVFNMPPAVGAQIVFQYVLAEQSYIGAFQETPLSNGGSNTVFNLMGIPINQMATMVYIDQKILPRTMWSLTFGNPCQIVLNNPIAPGQSVYVTYFIPASAWGGAVLGGTNLGLGTAIFAGISSGILQFKTLIPGTNVTLSNDANTVTINSTAGSIGAPIRQEYAPGGTITGVIDGSNAVFTLSNNIPYPQTLLVFVDGVAQINGVHYTLSGAGNNIVTFATAPSIGQKVLAQYNTT